MWNINFWMIFIKYLTESLEGVDLRKYSFVIPTYQNRKLVINTLRALDYIETTETISYEVIIVDDGSLDDTFQSVISEHKKYPFIYTYLPRFENSSRARARNYGLKNVTGDIVVFIDGDIIVRPDYLLKLDRFFEQSSDMAVVGMRLLLNQPIDEQIVNDKSIFDKNILSSFSTGVDFRYQIFENISYNAGSMKVPFLFALTCNLAVPKKWIDLTDGYDEELKKWGIEDIEFVYRMCQKGMKIAINTKGAVIHQFHGSKEEDTVEKGKIEEVDYNTSVLIKKYPGFLGLSDQEIYELFRSIAHNYTKLEIDNTTKSIEISYNDIKKYEDIIMEIRKYADDEAIKLSVLDYVENSELDIFIQLMTNVKAKILYFPKTIDFFR
jgi:glycosyltransferase involved in cell wall biosynthesis